MVKSTVFRNIFEVELNFKYHNIYLFVNSIRLRFSLIVSVNNDAINPQNTISASP